MRFEEVVPALRDGKKVRRFAWSFLKHMFLQKGKKASIDDRGSLCHSADADDLLCDDWEVVGD